MKNLLFHFLFRFIWMILPGSLFAQNGGWTQVNPIPGNDSYEYIHVDPDGQSGFAIGGGHSVIRTQNGGDHWVKTRIARKRALYNQYISFYNDSVGFVGPIGSDGSTYKTVDKGKTWKLVPSLVNRRPYFRNGIGFYSYSNFFFRSMDGGLTWESRSTNPFIQMSNLFEIQNKDTLWSFSGKTLVRSVNGGTNWSLYGASFPRRINKVYAYNNKQLYVLGDSGLCAYSLDGGANWTSQLIASPPGEDGIFFSNIFFSDAEHGWIFGYNNQCFYYTSDRGISWQKRGTLKSKYNATFTFIDTLRGWAGGHNGYLAKTVDGGQTWIPLNKGIYGGALNADGNIWTSAGQTADRVWVGGFNLLAYSDNQGMDWNQVQMNPTANEVFYHLKFVTPNLGFTGAWRKVYRTTDGGVHWQSVPIGIYPTRFYFLNPSIGWAWGINQFAKTTNGGLTWSNPVTDSAATEIKLHFFNEQEGLKMTAKMTGNNSFQVLKTSNGGLTFDSVRLNQLGTPTCMYFFNDQCGWIGTYTNKIYRTVNGGKTWQMQNSPVGSCEDFQFINPLEGYSSGDNGLAHTTDGGESWETIDTPVELTGGGPVTSFLMRNGKPSLITGGGVGIYVHGDWSDAGKTVVSGRIVEKQNSDCIQDPGEIPFGRSILSVEPGPKYASTNLKGKYALHLDSGSYSIKQVFRSQIPSYLESQFCPLANAPLSVEVTGLADTLPGNNFINDVKLCPVLAISLSQEVLRPCIKGRLDIIVENLGNVDSDSEYVEIKMPSHLHFLSADAIYDYNAVDSIYRFRIRPLQPQDGIRISIADSVSCNPGQLMGQILCVKATIPGIPTCLANAPNWDGANLEVASSCLPTGQTRFKIHNKGASMPSASQYQIFIDSALVHQAFFQLGTGSQMSVTLPVNAPPGFVRLRVPQSANHPLSTFASAEANCALGTSSSGMFPPADESPLVEIQCGVVGNSFDPNDKTVYPPGIGNEGKVEPETMLKYKIRFQNTGNDTAFKVVLVDTLDADLDIASLQIGAASHPYEFKVSGKGRPVLTWTFNNILLPDSNTNEEKSHGFVNFSIRPKTGLALGTRLENFADIYFDFNDPIRTNTTVNTLWVPTLDPDVLDTVFVTGTQKQIALKSLKISPNPAKDVLRIELPDGSGSILEMADLQGRVLQRIPLTDPQNVSVKDLKPGIYFLKVEGYRVERLVVKP